MLTMLDLDSKSEEELDLSKLRLACERLLACSEVSKVLDRVNIQADLLMEKDKLKDLRHIDGDAAIQAVFLAMYWNHKCAWEAVNKKIIMAA